MAFQVSRPPFFDSPEGVFLLPRARFGVRLFYIIRRDAAQVLL